MGMRATVRLGLAVLAGGLLSACAGTTEGGDCLSHYNPVASAPTWEGLKDAMLGYQERGRVASLRTQARGHAVPLAPTRRRTSVIMRAAASNTTALTTAKTKRTSTRSAPTDTLVGCSQGDDKPTCVGNGGSYQL